MNDLIHNKGTETRMEPTLHRSKARIQAKLMVNRPGDVYEQEADAMAERVMRMSPAEFQQNPNTGLIGASVQRTCSECEEEEKKRLMMRKTAPSGPAIQATSSLVSSLNASKGRGSSLPPATRNFMESAFSVDFSRVRIHTDSLASEMNKGINARAFTHGNDIYFKNGEYDPDKDLGKRLLAHELTHVVQQSSSSLIIQRDYAVELPNPDAAQPVLTEQQIQDAIRYNSRRYLLRNTWEIALVRDVLGLAERPTVVDTDLINAIALFQAQNNISADGKVGPITSARLSRELFREGRSLPAREAAELHRSSRRMGTRAMRINVNQRARNLDNLGSAHYGVMWEIPDRSANGFVIQHVTINGNIQDCTGNPVAMNGFAGNRNYWEVWRVVNGRVRCGTLAVSCVGSDDTFQTVSQNANTRGTITERGRVSYFPDYTLDAAWITGVAHPAGDLPHRAARPPFWNEGETMLHEMVVTYNACVRPSRSSVRTTP